MTSLASDLRPAQNARRMALLFSGIAVAFSLGFGFCIRRWYAAAHPEWTSLGKMVDDLATPLVLLALTSLLLAFLLRIVGAMCELVWLERTMSILPPHLRRVGPVKNVTAVHIFGIAFIPVVAWFWKLGLVRSVSAGLEEVRRDHPFHAPVPRALGTTAAILGWLPPLNLYVAPFLWELFARRIDQVFLELSRVGQGERSPS